MKLYGYKLDSFLGRHTLQLEEVEVEENPKTYKGRFSLNYGSSLNKNDIGKLIGYSNDTIYLLEPNIELAKTILRKRYADEYALATKKYEDRIEALK